MQTHSKSHSQKGIGMIVPIIAVAALALILGGGWYAIKHSNILQNVRMFGPPNQACTLEAKLCPDGKTFVSRTGPNCEFAACPQVNDGSTLRVPLPKNCSIVSGPKPRVDLALGTPAGFEWTIDCGTSDKLINRSARSTLAPSLKAQGWKFCDSQTATANWWKNGILLGIVEPTVETFRITQEFSEQECENVSWGSWKTYRNEKYGFEFKHPSEWSVAPEARQSDGSIRITFVYPERVAAAVPMELTILNLATGKPCGSRDYFHAQLYAGDIAWEKPASTASGVDSWEVSIVHMNAERLSIYFQKENCAAQRVDKIFRLDNYEADRENYDKAVFTFQFLQ